MTQSAVLLKDVTLTLPSRAGNVEILKGVDLSVKSGEAIGIVGPSGSGKTSLLMLIAGLERATSGTLEVAGTSLKNKNEDALAAFRRDTIGIIFQSFHLIPTMTALENVAVPLEFRGVANAMGIAEEKLKRVGLSHRLSHYPGPAFRRRTTARGHCPCLGSGARILLADEPTGNLDQETGEQIIKLLFELRQQEGASLLLITHDRALAKRCDRIAEVRDGKIISGNHP